MPYVLPILMRYRYWILASLSLLLISEMVVAGIDLVPIEHEWVLGWFLFITTSTCVGMAGVISVVAPVGGRLMKYVYRILAAFPLALFVLLVMVLIPILQPLAEIFWRPYLLLLVMAWIGSVVIVSIITTDPARSTKISVRGTIPLELWDLRLFSVMVIVWAGLLVHYWTILGDLLPGHFLLIPSSIVLSNSLILGAVALRTMLAGRRRTLLLYTVLALTAFGISAVTFAAAVVLGTLSLVITGMSFIFVIFLLVAISNSVFTTALIGTMPRPIPNIVVTGIGLLVMILVVGWYWQQTMDNGLYAFSGEERAAAERVLKNAKCPDTPLRPIDIRIVKSGDGEFLLRGYTWWRLPTGDCRQP